MSALMFSRDDEINQLRLFAKARENLIFMLKKQMSYMTQLNALFWHITFERYSSSVYAKLLQRQHMQKYRKTT